MQSEELLWYIIIRIIFEVFLLCVYYIVTRIILIISSLSKNIPHKCSKHITKLFPFNPILIFQTSSD